VPSLARDPGALITARILPTFASRNPSDDNRRAELADITAPAPAPVRFNAHTDPARPPQTPAASFKRLYRE
jgi:hypothetical protein